MNKPARNGASPPTGYLLAMVVGLVLLVTALHYLTSTLHTPFHDIYRRLYYLPIVLGGLWFGLRGGLVTAATVSLLYLPHALWQLVPFQGNLLEQGLEMLLYHVVAGVTGALADRERRQQRRYRQAALRLEQSYGQLRQQADALLAAQEQLRHSERLSALGEMGASLAHEIRNPLGAIRMAAEVVTDGLAPTDRRHEFGQILLKEVQRLNGVLEDFLNLARQRDDAPDRVALQPLLLDLARQLSPVAETAGVAVSVADTDAVIHIARLPLQQALLNLALNGIQAMPDGGVLNLAAERTAESVRVRVCDSGTGIAPEYLERIFAPFFTTREEGTGLGLAITERLVQRLGGRIDVDSQPGAGTCFIIDLPTAGTEGHHGR